MSFFPLPPHNVSEVLYEFYRVSMALAQYGHKIDDDTVTEIRCVLEDLTDIICWMNNELPRFNELHDDLSGTLDHVVKIRSCDD